MIETAFYDSMILKSEGEHKHFGLNGKQRYSDKT